MREEEEDDGRRKERPEGKVIYMWPSNTHTHTHTHTRTHTHAHTHPSSTSNPQGRPTLADVLAIKLCVHDQCCTLFTYILHRNTHRRAHSHTHSTSSNALFQGALFFSPAELNFSVTVSNPPRGSNPPPLCSAAGVPVRYPLRRPHSTI